MRLPFLFQFRNLKRVLFFSDFKTVCRNKSISWIHFFQRLTQPLDKTIENKLAASTILEESSRKRERANHSKREREVIYYIWREKERETLWHFERERVWNGMIAFVSPTTKVKVRERWKGERKRGRKSAFKKFGKIRFLHCPEISKTSRIKKCFF